MVLSRRSCLAILVALAPSAAFVPLQSGMLYGREGVPPLTQRSALATSTKETISAMTKATQAALQSRCSRMDVELPPGAALGVETPGKAEKKGGNSMFGLLGGGQPKSGPAALLAVQRSDRELARLFVEMFRPIGDAVTVVFSTGADAAAASNAWASDTRVLAFNDVLAAAGGPAVGGASPAPKAKNLGARKALKAKGGKGGFAAKVAAATAPSVAAALAASSEVALPAAAGTSAGLRAGLLPPNTEVLLVVAPKGGDLAAVEAICSAVGQGTCVVLLNARLETARFPGGEPQEAFFLDTFEPVFQLKPPPPQARLEAETLWAKAAGQASAAASGGGSSAAAGVATPILFRAFPDAWALYSQPAVGPPRQLAEFPQGRPTTAALVACLTNPETLAKEGAGFEGQLTSLLGQLGKGLQGFTGGG